MSKTSITGRHSLAALTSVAVITVFAVIGSSQQVDARASLDTPSALLAGAGCAASGVDGDRDQIDDGVENCLLQRFAPVVHLADGNNYNSPWNVDSYLQNSLLKAAHEDAPDCDVAWGPTQDYIATASHPNKGWSFRQGWHHTSDIHQATTKGDITVFQITGNANRNPSYPAEWVTYGHVYLNNSGGVSLGFWFFYPWNDGLLTGNHEGDWENINVVLDRNFNPIRVIFFAHGTGYPSAASAVAWTGTHPEVWSAAGSHADYVSSDVCNNTLLEGPAGHPCTSVPDYRWYTWAGGQAELGYPPGLQGGSVVNVGEIGAPLNGQSWVNYRDMWGSDPFGSPLTSRAGPFTPGSDGSSVYADWSIDALRFAVPIGGCGEAACVPNQGMYVSHFSGPSCTGTESYYLPYDGYAYNCRSWDGAGKCGTVRRTVTNYSARINGGACQDLWPAGNTLSDFVTVYRGAAGRLSALRTMSPATPSLSRTGGTNSWPATESPDMFP